MTKGADYWIEKLNLQPHPEGGYFRETYRAPGKMRGDPQGSGVSSDRPFSTAIYFLLKGPEVSKFHRLRSDEIWHFYEGNSLILYVIDAMGRLSTLGLGPDAERDEHFQAIVRAGCWFGAEVTNSESYSLVGCTVAPGFDFDDFELGRRETLLLDYPAYRDVIIKLT